MSNNTWIRDHYPDLPSLLADLRERPGMWLGKKTAYGLEMLVRGIEFAEEFHNVPAEARVGGFDFAEFEAWVERAYNPDRLTLRSFGMAVHAAGSEADGFDLWFRWYDEYAATLNREAGD